MSTKDEDFFSFDEREQQPPVRGWAREQMIECESCGRPNAPTRPACLYCGERLPINEQNKALRRPLLRPLEKGEKGYNIVLIERAPHIAAEELAQVSEALQLQTTQLQAICEQSFPLPLARAPSPDEAALIVANLTTRGWKIQIVPDEMLTADALPPYRISSLEFTDKSIVGWTFGEMNESVLPWSDVSLCVIGRIFVREVQVEERPARGAENEIVETRELDADETVFDLYTAHDPTGWRIAAHSFDFSCLGHEKRLTVTENMMTLRKVIAGHAVRATFDDSYSAVRPALAPVWPLEQHTESRGWRRGRFGGGFNTGTAMITSNLAQFTAYSRLRYHFTRER